MLCDKIDGVICPLKIILFLSFAAASSLLPYLNIHMQQLGFTIHETAIICSLLPFGDLFAFVLIKGCTSFLRTPRTVLMHTLFISAGCASLLLVLPELPLPEHRHHSLHMVCGPTIKPRVIVDKCGVSRKCNKVQRDDVIYLQFSACSVQCPDHGIDMREPVNVADLCFDDEFGRLCHVVEVNNTLSENFTFGLYLNSPEDRVSDCYYPVDAVIWHKLVYHRMSCPIIIRHLNKGNCSLKCRFQEVYDVSATLSFDKEECVYVSYKRWLYVALYFIVRFFLHVMIAVMLILLKNSLSLYTRLTDGKYTFANVCNSVATAIFPPLSGVVIDINSSVERPDYSDAIYFFDGLVVIVAALVIILDAQIIAPSKNNCLKDIKELLCQTEYTLFLVVEFWLGVIWGYIETFLFWYLLEFGTPKYVMGLTIAVGSLTGLPFLQKYRMIVRKMGCVNILWLALLMYCGRCVAYSLITEGWWSVVLAVTDLLTHHLVSVVTSLYCSYIVPREILGSGESLIRTTHYCLGKASGSIIGGGVMGVFGAHITFRVLGASSGILGLVYLCIFYTCLFKRSGDVEDQNASKAGDQVWNLSEEEDVFPEDSLLKDSCSNDKGTETVQSLGAKVAAEWVEESLVVDVRVKSGHRKDYSESNKSIETDRNSSLDKVVVIVHKEN